MCFFFSSRRRHTRFDCDWSSDVCSSDLLWVVGDGPDRERLERIASELRLAARVRWTGALPPEEMTRLWAELDVLVQPSRELPGWAEQSAHAVAEAMAHEVAGVWTGARAAPGGVAAPPA